MNLLEELAKNGPAYIFVAIEGFAIVRLFNELIKSTNERLKNDRDIIAANTEQLKEIKITFESLKQLINYKSK
jgi:hypothetical protein